MFLDEATIEVSSGRGGNGCASFRQEKHVPHGGPDGGDGGDGGSVIFVADSKVNTLIEFHNHTHFHALNGGNGEGANRHGANGKSIRLRVPIGTVIKESVSGNALADLVTDGQKHIVCKGGRGGKGNLHFTNSVRQAPTFAQMGDAGVSRKIKLELKLIADVGLVGLPNAGKSTFISAVSAAKPKIADYPFTTLKPNLGIVRVSDDSFVMADLPGLIEGAADGKGLGHRFLKHAERTRVILHLVECDPIDGGDPKKNYELIENELKRYSPEMYNRPRIVVLTKCDLIPDEELREALVGELSENNHEVFGISAVTGEALQPLLFRIAEILKQTPATVTSVVLEPQPDINTVDKWEIVEETEGLRVSGDRIERMVARTDLENSEALEMLHRRLRRKGVFDKLRERGAKDGDAVFIGHAEFTYVEED